MTVSVVNATKKPHCGGAPNLRVDTTAESAVAGSSVVGKSVSR